MKIVAATVGLAGLVIAGTATAHATATPPETAAISTSGKARTLQAVEQVRIEARYGPGYAARNLAVAAIAGLRALCQRYDQTLESYSINWDIPSSKWVIDYIYSYWVEYSSSDGEGSEDSTAGCG